MKFDSLGLHADILKGVADAGFEKCTPIQEQSLPECLQGKDMIAQSQTGTGKTAVFVLSIYSALMKEGAPSDKPKALVMVPTRELAVQVEQDARKLGKHLPLKTVAIFGGVDYDRQASALKGGIDLVVATPGRMIDLYKSKTLSLDDISIFVIDEADRMFDMGFAPDITYIASHLPKDKPRQTMLFSATIDSNVERLASRYMKPDLLRIVIEPEQVTVDAIDQKVIYTSNEEKLPVLMGLLKRPDAEMVIIFANMKRTAEMLEWKLQGNGFPAKALTGDMTQARRQKVIDGMKAGTIKILVATDVAARGLHIDGVTHVVNYDLPEEAANYVHRIGRTARAGKTGKAYSLVCESYAFNLPEIEKYIERKIESEWIEDADLVEDKAGRYSSRPRGGARSSSGKSSSRSGGRPSSSRRGSSSRGSSSRGPSSRGPSRKASSAPEGEAKPAQASEARHAPEEESYSTSWSEVKSALKKEKRQSPDRGQKGRGRGEAAEGSERERPGRIVKPERVRKPRPARPAPPPIEAEGVSAAGEGEQEKSGAPRRRRRRRRSSGSRGGADRQAASAAGQGQTAGAENQPSGTLTDGRPAREGEQGTGQPRRRRRRPPRGRGPRPSGEQERASESKPAQGAPAPHVSAPAPAPSPASTEPKKPKAGGLLKKVLGVFKKRG